MLLKSPLIIDLSLWEQTINWAKLSPVPDGVIIKASEYRWPDPMTESHYKGATSLNLPRGLYHFYRPTDLTQQVTTFFAQAQKVGAWDGSKWLAELPPILDAEYAPPAPPRKKPKNYVYPPRGDKLAADYKFLLDQFGSISGRTPIIYTSPYYWGFTANWLGKVPAWSSNYLLWVAEYPNQPDKFDKPYMAVPGWAIDDWALWQYNDAARFEGVPYDGVDVSKANPQYWSHIARPPEVPLLTEEERFQAAFDAELTHPAMNLFSARWGWMKRSEIK